MIKTWLIAAALLLLPLAAHGAGMGRLVVNSALGEPLKAEIELVSIKKEEIGSLTAKLASPEQFKQANLDFTAVHARLKLSVGTRPDGAPFIKVTTSQPVQDPFVAILVELSWPSGRLLREYTFLLDPPGFDTQKPIAPVAKSAAPLPPVVAAPEKAEAVAPAAEPAVQPAVQPAEEPARAAAAPKEPGAGTYGPVKRGDTLSKIALGAKPEGVSLDQMLVALYRANREAFMGNNMNRMKTGPILRVPDSTELANVDFKEARKEVRAQSADWNAYRQRLAAVAASGAPETKSQQTAAGKISAAVEDKMAAKEPAKEVLKLSKGEIPGDKAAGAKGLQERVRAMEEEAIAREKTLREANERAALLEKNIKEMQKLLEVKSQGLAEAQKQAAAAKPAEPEPARPVAAEAKPEAAAPAVQPAPAATPEMPKPEAAKPGAKPAEPKPAPKPKAAPSAPAGKSLLDEFLDNPLYLGAIVVVLVALIGAGFLALRRKKKPAAEAVEAGEEMKTRITHATVAAEPEVAGVPEPAPFQADEVDPIAEAEVYLTYGRDTQAEEILKEALAKNASRHEVHLKLLEIYSNRKDKAAFEAAARGFQAAGGSGAAWEKVINMGIALDPANPLYAGGVAAASGVVAAAAAEAPDVSLEASQAPAKVDFDFDLDLGASAPAPQPAAVPQAPAPETSAAEAPAPKAESMDMDFDVTALGGEAPKPEAAAPAPSVDEGLTFDISVPPVEAPAAPEPAATPAASELSFGDISFDLGETPKAESAGAEGQGKDAHWQEVATKFDLAKAYQEMGDKDGAREILEEVLREGDAQQQEAAKTLLASL